MLLATARMPLATARCTCVRVAPSRGCVQAGRRKGKADAAIREGLEVLEAILPGLVNLHKAKAGEFALLAVDAAGVMDKVRGEGRMHASRHVTHDHGPVWMPRGAMPWQALNKACGPVRTTWTGRVCPNA